MTDVQSLTPWILAGVGIATGLIAWFFKQLILQPLKDLDGKVDDAEKDIVAIQTAFKYYVESRAQGAAKVLDSPNPTPPEMRRLLRLYYEGKASEAEHNELRCWLKELIDNPESPKSERSAALDILTAMGTMKILTRHAHGRSN